MGGPGRPRSKAARSAVLRAALEIVQESGYPVLTMEGIARRAAVSKQTVYRWWPSKAAVLLEALNEGATEIAPLPDTGDLADDLRAFLRRSTLGARGRTARLLVALMAEAQLYPAFGRSFQTGFLAQRRAVMVELLQRARTRGEIRSDVDLELVTELFFGALWYRLLAGSGTLDRRFADQITDLLLRLVAEA
ncbi:MAG TPA: TetR/AcrR family transcriptional regulator [Solirubrobacteraceae bacterium]|jgi:AcrR family transcriptional regulator|nr:TetR/AcrR family transcriptional regulator [Solirubrobacteraceae bacterium]